jgi:hypothetical protein
MHRSKGLVLHVILPSLRNGSNARFRAKLPYAAQPVNHRGLLEQAVARPRRGRSPEPADPACKQARGLLQCPRLARFLERTHATLT